MDFNKISQFGRIRIYFHESVECTGFASKIVVVNSLANDESITTRYSWREFNFTNVGDR